MYMIPSLHMCNTSKGVYPFTPYRVSITKQLVLVQFTYVISAGFFRGRFFAFLITPDLGHVLNEGNGFYLLIEWLTAPCALSFFNLRIASHGTFPRFPHPLFPGAISGRKSQYNENPFRFSSSGS